MVLHRNLIEADDNLHVPKSHTHVEAHITDLDKYTKAEVDALIAAITGDYVLTAGDIMTGSLALQGSGLAVSIDNAPGMLYEVNKIELLQSGLRQSSFGAGVGEFFLSGLGIELLGSSGQTFGVTLPGPSFAYFATSAPSGFFFEDNLKIDGVLEMADDNKIRAESQNGPPMDLIRLDSDGGDDDIHVGDIAATELILHGGATRPKYNSYELARMFDITGVVGDYLPLAGGTLTGNLIMDWGTALQVDVGAMETPTNAVRGNSFGVLFGDSGSACQLLGSLTRPLYEGTELALISDVMTPAAHAHFYEDTTIETVSNGDPVNPEVLFDLDGDVVTIETTEVKVTYG